MKSSEKGQFLIRILIDEAFPEGKPHDLKVQLEGPVIDILKVELHPLVKVLNLITAINLPEAGQTWLHAQTALLPLSERIY